MAALKCPVHGRQEESDRTLCAICMEFLVPDVPTVPDDSTQVGAEVCLEPGCELPLVGGACPVHSLGGAAGGGQPVRATRRDRDAPARVWFPWGPVDVGLAEVWIGRDPDCGAVAVRLDDFDNVSRRHAVLFRRGDEFWVRDQNSTNGTFVNERRVEPGVPHRLHHGDAVRFAADLRGTVELPEEPR